MKSILLGTVTAAALVMGAQAASAADVSVPIFFNYWTGAYAGLQGGWGWTSTKGLNASGDFGGGQLGYNYQVGNFVFGLEADGALASITSHDVTIPFLGVPDTIGYRDDGLASLRGRFGVATGNIFFYGTAGGGWVHSKASTLVGVSPLVSVSTSAAAWQTGWSAGAVLNMDSCPAGM